MRTGTLIATFVDTLPERRHEMATKLLVDLERCIGCWTCSMACKMGWNLEDEDFRVIVRTLGSGVGIDRPQGVYPNLKMTWQPIFRQSCTFCAPHVAEGHEPHCSHNCPTEAIAFGNPADAESPYSIEAQRCKDMKYRLFEIPDFEGSRANVTYATRK